MKNSKVTIIIPCYNHEEFVADCLESVIAQDYANIEVILCDDASNDNSWEIIQSYKTKLEIRFEKVVLLKNEKNLGITKTLNRMLRCAEGEYIKLIASDDMLVHSCIGDMVDIFEKDEKIGVVVSNGWIVAEDQKYEEIFHGECFYKETPDFNIDDLFDRLYMRNFIFAPGAAARETVYRELGEYDENICTEDWEYWLRVSKEKKYYFMYLDKCEVLYRRSGNSMTSMTSNELLEKRRINIYLAEMKIIEKYGKYCSDMQYAKRKYYKIYEEYRLATMDKLYSLKNIVKKQYSVFYMNERKRLCMKDRLHIEIHYNLDRCRRE